jgi:hypothetical protein
MNIAQDSFRTRFVKPANRIHSVFPVHKTSALNVKREFEMLQKRTLCYGPGVDSASKRNENQELSWEGKWWPAHKAENLTAICESIV